MSTKKDFRFKLLACILPFLLLLLLEALLRIVGYGDNLSLFVEDPQHKRFLVLNSKVSLRYFVREWNATTGNMDIFPEKKKKNAVRIFVQGESTATGFPYFNNGSFVRMLTYRLNQSYPDMPWEVVNLSMTALNSYALYDFTDEIIAQNPDAVIINAGHNEYYGALGVGSTGRMGNVSISRIGIAFRKTRMGQLFSKLTSSFSQDAVEIENEQNEQTLMQRMVRNQEIPFGSRMYEMGLAQFEKNLKETLEKYQNAGIQVFLTTAVSNLKDQPPFISVLSPSNPQPELWLETFDTAMRDQDTVRMLQTIHQLHSVDSCYSLSWYVLGGIMYSQKQYDAAKKAYVKAKELDALRFRAPEAINSIMRDLSLKYDHVVLVDVEKAFEERSPNGIIGKSLMLEHLHPNLSGHFIIADALFRSFENEKFAGITGENSATFEELPILKIDSLRGEHTLMLMRERWPFNEPMPPDDENEKSLEQVFAKGLSMRSDSWTGAMHILMEHYTNAEQFDIVVKIAESLILEYPYEYIRYEEIVDLCFHARQFRKGIHYARKAYSLKKMPEIAQRLLFFHLALDEPEEALSCIDALIASDKNTDYSAMKDITQKIIAAKQRLLPDENNQAIKDEIYHYYMSIQIVDAAEKYKTK